MKIDRLMAIVTLLLQQGQMTAPQLAARFEVSPRTIRRDIDTLCQAGIPLVTTQGYQGGISIAEGYTLDKSLLTAEEVQTLLAGLQGVHSVAAENAALLSKLALHRKQTHEDYLIIDLASHYKDSLQDKFEAIKQAILSRYLLTFTYHSSRGDTQRIVEPYRLLYKWDTWYLLGYCTGQQDFRLFKLNRLWNLTSLEEQYMPRSFSPELLSFTPYFSQENYRLKALFAPQVAYRLIEEYGVESYQLQESGRLLFEMPFASYDYLLTWVLSFGSQVQVLEPRQLAEDIVEQAKNLIAHYEKQDK